MQTRTKREKFLHVKSIYTKVTLWMVVASTVLLITASAIVRSVTAAPTFIINIATLVFFYHIIHFIFGIIFLLSYLFSIKKHIGKVRMIKVIGSILFTPISFLIAYFAVFLLALSSCTG